MLSRFTSFSPRPALDALAPILAALAVTACTTVGKTTASGAGGSKGTSTVTGAGGNGVGGGCAALPDPFAAKRAACTFATGAKVADTLGLDAKTRASLPIKHVVVLMKENRSFDHVFGSLHSQGQPATEAVPASFTNPDASGKPVAPFHAASTCVPSDPDHQWDAMHADVDGGKMDGFVKSAAASAPGDGHFVMGEYDQNDLPFDYFLGRTFALNDRHFASARSGTFPNRNFLLLGTPDGVMSTGDGFPDPATPTILTTMDAGGVTWGAYSDGSLFSGTLNWASNHPGAHPFADFIAALDAGTLPQVAFVDGYDNVEDEHAPANLEVGEAWTRLIYEHAIASPLWPGLAILWTYDEGGGYADHVPPPNNACVPRPLPKDAIYNELGARVPLVVISPWARAHSVDHTVEDHTAITRFIEAVFDLPALTARDANASALLEMFDFTCGPALLQPPDAPAAGTNGCGGGIVLTKDKPTYAPGDPIHITFFKAPANNAKDWIALYPNATYGPTPPHPPSLAWEFVGGTRTPTTAPAVGTITLDASSVNGGVAWPLAPGSYAAYYLLDNGYVSATSLKVTIQ